MNESKKPRLIHVASTADRESFESLPEAVNFLSENNQHQWGITVPSELDIMAKLEGEKPHQTVLISLWGKEMRVPRKFGDSTEGLSVSADPKTNHIWTFNLSVLPYDDVVFDRGTAWLFPYGPQTSLSFAIKKDQPLAPEELNQRVDSFMQRSGRILIDLSRGEV